MSQHWPDIARQWAQVGPPLRPRAEDLAFVAGSIAHWSTNRRALRALILGVTPELYRLPWPSGSSILAVDHTQAMIDAIWPGPRDAAICAEWTDLPLDANSRDIILCDGGFHLLNYPADQTSLVRGLQRIVAPGGLCIFRLYIPPAIRESPQAVLDDLLAAKITDLNVLKIRLGMAMQVDSTSGVQLGKIWEAIHLVAPDFESLATKIGWPLEHLLAINTYRDSAVRYCFVTVDEVRNLFCDQPGGFEFELIRFPEYALGERFPTIIFRKP